ncbi:MAG: xylulokinase [Beutenbergiaceae bacterium]
MKYAVGCDVGSQSLKAVVLASDGQVLAKAGEQYSMSHRHSGWAEQSPQDYVTAMASAVRQALDLAGVSGSDVTVLGLASQVDGVVPVDARLQPLREAIMWLDRRAVTQAEALRSAVGTEAAFQLTGLNIDASHTGPKIMWLRDNEPDVFNAAASMPSVGSYVLAWLTGELAQDHANASSTLFYDIQRRAYSPDMLAAAGIDAGLLPPVVDAEQVVGILLPHAADALGLSRQCQVVVGTGDEHGACVGAGGVVPDVVIDIAGTAEPVCVGSNEALIDETKLVETHAHALRDRYLIENPGFVSGGNTLWLAEVLGCTQAEVFSLAEQSVPGANGVLFIPALSGAMAPRWNDRMRGAFYGIGMNNEAADLARAVVEGNAFAFTDIERQMRQMGLGGSIRIVGGGRRSEFSMVTKATLADCLIDRVTTEETTAVGAAMVAAIGAGIYQDVPACVSEVVSLADDPIEPDPGIANALADAYGNYRELYDALETTFAQGEE